MYHNEKYSLVLMQTQEITDYFLLYIVSQHSQLHTQRLVCIISSAHQVLSLLRSTLHVLINVPHGSCLRLDRLGKGCILLCKCYNYIFSASTLVKTVLYLYNVCISFVPNERMTLISQSPIHGTIITPVSKKVEQKSYRK